MIDFFMNYPYHIKNILSGLKATLIIALLSAGIGLIIGTCLALMRNSRFKVLRTFSKVYTDIIRGTPILLQLSIVHYIILATLPVTPLFSAITAFSVNSGAYIAEIIRSGIENIDKGQIEAAETLGASKWDIAKDIVIPLAFRKTLPPLINEMASLIKESSIVSTILVADVMYHANRAITSTMTYFEPLIIASVCYYVLVKLMTLLGKKVEVYFNYDHN